MEQKLKIVVMTADQLDEFKSEIVDELIKKLKPHLSNKIGDNDDEWFSDEQAQEYLRFSRTTLYNYRNRGEINFSKRANKIFYKKSELDIFLEGNFN